MTTKLIGEFVGSARSERDFVQPLFTVVAGLSAVLAVEIFCVLLASHGQLFIYPSEAAYTHLALADQIAQGRYGLFPGESAAPSSSIFYPVLLAALKPLGLGAMLPLAINIASTLAAGFFALLLARETQISVPSIPRWRLFLLTVVIAIALDLPGLAVIGLEHSLHIAMTVAYLLGLVRFVTRGRCDWWWFACIIIQPTIRFEAAGMLVADAMIFVAFRRFGYALATMAIGILLVGGYSYFLHSLGLPLLPSSVLNRSEWSNAAVSSHNGPFTVISAIVQNLYANLRSFGAAEMLGGLALALPWLGGVWTDLWRRPFTKSEQIKVVTLAFMIFVTASQLTGGQLGQMPPRYEAYVLTLNLCGIAIIYRERVSAWCEFATWPRVLATCLALLMIFAGYATQFLFLPARAEKEYEGPYQLHRFVTDFYRGSVAANILGYINFENPNYVLDLSGGSSEVARQARSRDQGPGWMDDLMASHGIGLAIIDSTNDKGSPSVWTIIADLRPIGIFANDPTLHYLLYARRPADIPAVVNALDRYAPTLPPGSHLKRIYSRSSDSTSP